MNIATKTLELDACFFLNFDTLIFINVLNQTVLPCLIHYRKCYAFRLYLLTTELGYRHSLYPNERIFMGVIYILLRTNLGAYI